MNRILPIINSISATHIALASFLWGLIIFLVFDGRRKQLEMEKLKLEINKLKKNTEPLIKKATFQQIIRFNKYSNFVVLIISTSVILSLLYNQGLYINITGAEKALTEEIKKKVAEAEQKILAEKQQSLPSEEIEEEIQPPKPQKPVAPTNLSATGGIGIVTLQWKPVKLGSVTGYKVFRYTILEGEFRLITIIKNKIKKKYVDKAVENDQLYSYKVVSYDEYSNSEFSKTVQVRTAW